jgi:protein TonB
MSSVTPADRCTDAQRRLPRLAYFVTGSVLLHTLVVMVWRGEPPAAPVGQGSFQITLLAEQGGTPGSAGDQAGEPSNTAIEPSMENGEASAAERKLPAVTELASVQPLARAAAVSRQSASQVPSPARKRDQQASRAAKVRRDKPAASADQAPGAASAGSESRGRDALSSDAKYRRVRAALHEALLPRFDYPSVARRRGWQGRVRVGLHVEADGDLSRIRLVESSGYVLLDKAAVKNVTELRNVPAVTQWLDGSDMDVILPVRYQLQDR